MKKLIIKTTVFLMIMMNFVFAALLTAFARSNTWVFIDKTNTVSAEMRQEIESELKLISETFDVDAVAVYTDDPYASSNRADLENVYSKGEYSSDCYLYGINTETREHDIITRGWVTTNLLFDSQAEDILYDDVVMDLLRNDNFIEAMPKILRLSFETMEYNNSTGSTESSSEKTTFDYIHIYIIVAIVLAAAAVIIMVSMNRFQKNQTNSRTYLNGDSFNLTNARNDYITTTITKTRIDTNNNSGGGSAGRSSSGASGGASGRF